MHAVQGARTEAISTVIATAETTSVKTRGITAAEDDELDPARKRESIYCDVIFGCC